MFLVVHPDGLIIIKHMHFKILYRWENVDCKRNPAQSTDAATASARSLGHNGAHAWETAAKPPRDPTASFLHMTDWEKRSLQRAKRIFPGRSGRLQKKKPFLFCKPH